MDPVTVMVKKMSFYDITVDIVHCVDKLDDFLSFGNPKSEFFLRDAQRSYV